jgi:hypothetical protein
MCVRITNSIVRDKPNKEKLPKFRYPKSLTFFSADAINWLAIPLQQMGYFIPFSRLTVIA